MSLERCEHHNFSATVNVGRLSKTDGGPITSYNAELRICCADCGRPFQFLGLEAGLDLRGARVSVDGLEANLALCPQGEELSPLDRMVVNFSIPRARNH